MSLLKDFTTFIHSPETTATFKARPSHSIDDIIQFNEAVSAYLQHGRLPLSVVKNGEAWTVEKLAPRVAPGIQIVDVKPGDTLRVNMNGEPLFEFKIAPEEWPELFARVPHTP